MKKIIKLSALSLGMALSGIGQSAVVTIQSTPSEVSGGLNDMTPMTPLPTNPGITLGAQKWFVLQAAANQWGRSLQSSVETKVQVSHIPLVHMSTLTVSMTASPAAAIANAAGVTPLLLWPANDLGTFGGYSFPVALANAQSNRDIIPGRPHVRMSEADLSSNLSVDFASDNSYYAHALLGMGGGFGDVLDFGPGSGRISPPYVTSAFIYNGESGLTVGQMNIAESLRAGWSDYLLWQGTFGTLAYFATQNQTQPLVTALPAMSLPVADFSVRSANFGGPLPTTLPAISARAVLVDDSDDTTGSIMDACTPLTNSAAIAGNIAIISRGVCPFTLKARHAQMAGARAVIITNNVPGPVNLASGVATDVTIPVLTMSEGHGVALRTALGGGRTITLNIQGSEGVLGMYPYAYPRLSAAPSGASGEFRAGFMHYPVFAPTAERPVSPLSLGVLKDIGWETNEILPENRAPRFRAISTAMAGTERVLQLDVVDPDENNVLFVTLSASPLVSLRAIDPAASAVKIFSVHDSGQNKLQLIGKAADLNAYIGSGNVRVGAIPGVLEVTVSDPSGPVSIAHTIEL